MTVEEMLHLTKCMKDLGVGVFEYSDHEGLSVEFFPYQPDVMGESSSGIREQYLKFLREDEEDHVAADVAADLEAELQKAQDTKKGMV